MIALFCKQIKEGERKKNRYCVIGMFLCLMSMLTLTGCNQYSNTENDMKNVEERDYATILLITEGTEDKEFHFVLGIAQEKKMGEKSMTEEVSEWDCADFKELSKVYASVKGKDLSLAHLKIILFAESEESTNHAIGENTGTNHAKESTKKQDLLYMLDESEEIAKTCPVLLLPEPETFLAYLEEEDKPVGNYLENLIRETERQGQEITELKDYLKAMREQKDRNSLTLQRTGEGWVIQQEEKKIGNGI